MSNAKKARQTGLKAWAGGGRFVKRKKVQGVNYAKNFLYHCIFAWYHI